MKVSLEHLYHFKCDRCQKWWTVGDIEPKLGSAVFCPHCGQSNVVEAVESFKIKG